MSNPLFVTDQGVAELPITSAALDICRSAGLSLGVFSDIKPNPVGANVDEGVRAIRAGGHDGVIAFGGGSALDVGKTLALMAGQTLPWPSFEDVGDNWTQADDAAILPIVAVPTTSGTGSEVGRCSVIVEESQHRKVVLFHPMMMPGRVLCDPELTAALPPHITAAVGMDALAHNLEALCAPGWHPQADGIALEGIRLVAASLLRATQDGADLAARSDMMAAALMGATSFQKGLGAIHSLSHPVSAHLDSHHGLTNAVFMPYVLVANRSAIEDRVVSLSRYLGLANASWEGFISWVLELREALGIPHSADALGMTAEHIEPFASEAELDPTAATNPVPVTKEWLASIYRKALSGDLSP